MKSGQNGNTKVWMLVAALAVAIAAVVFFGSNYPPDSEMAAGTIVPAERYRSDQIAKEDVVLGDEDGELLSALSERGVAIVATDANACLSRMSTCDCGMSTSVPSFYGVNSD